MEEALDRYSRRPCSVADPMQAGELVSDESEVDRIGHS